MKKISIFILSVAAICCMLFAACADSAQVSFSGIRNLSLGAAVSEYDFLAGVSARSDGEPAEVSVDASSVQWGKAGNYTITYSCGDARQTAVVRIYEMPVVSAHDANLTYEQAYEGYTDDITVKDSFGISLIPEVIDYGVSSPEMYRYGGNYEVTYSAADAAGNSVQFKRKITVTGMPLSYGAVNIDLVSPEAEVDLGGAQPLCIEDENYGIFRGIAGDGNILLLGEAAAAAGVGSHEMTLYTSAGYGTIALNVTDNEDIECRYNVGTEEEGINGYIYAVGEKVVLPELIPASGSYQLFEANYTLTFNGEEITDKENFVPQEEGAYIYTAQAVKGEYETTLVSEFYVVSEREKLNRSFGTDTNQFISNFNPYYTLGSTIDYAGMVSDANYESHRAVRFLNNAAQTSSERTLEFNIDLVEDILSTGSYTLSFKFLFGEGYEDVYTDNVYVYLFAMGSSGWTRSLATYPLSTSNRTWTELAFDLRYWTNPYGFPGLYSIDVLGNVVMNYETFGIITSPYEAGNTGVNRDDIACYIADLEFGTTQTSISDITYYDFDTGDSVNVASGLITADIDGEVATYENFNLSEYGVIKLLEDQSGEIISSPVFGVITNGVLSCGGRDYISLSYEDGMIYSTGEEITFSRYGRSLVSYGYGVSYALYTAEGVPVQFDTRNFTKTFDDTEAGGYNLKMTVSGSSDSIEFDNLFYVTNGTDFYGANVTSDYLRYAGYVDVNGDVKECFAVLAENNSRQHRMVTISADYVNQMLDEGRTLFTLTINTPYPGAADQQTYRVKDGQFTYSGNNGTSFVHGEDYWNCTRYDQFVSITFNIDESYRDKSFGFVVMRDTVIGDMTFTEPA